MKDVIIVEDGAQERERLKKILSDAGYSVVACESVAQAEGVVKYEHFRLAILDIGLGDRSGSYLFTSLKRSGKVTYIVIFTGNPSVHLKQRFLDEGAADYIVKGSPAAQSEPLLNRVRELIGEPQRATTKGIPLEEFLALYVADSSRSMFLDGENRVAACSKCGQANYVVTFLAQPQVPPSVTGVVVCAGCETPMDPEVG